MRGWLPRHNYALFGYHAADEFKESANARSDGRPKHVQADPWAAKCPSRELIELLASSNQSQLAKALLRLAPAELVLTEIPFRDLPLYCYDFDADFLPTARDLKSALAAVDAVLFVTPEYNRSIPGGLKNAIDWARRPYGLNSFSRKPSAIIGTSPGKMLWSRDAIDPPPYRM